MSAYLYVSLPILIFSVLGFNFSADIPRYFSRLVFVFFISLHKRMVLFLSNIMVLLSVDSSTLLIISFSSSTSRFITTQPVLPTPSIYIGFITLTRLGYLPCFFLGIIIKSPFLIRIIPYFAILFKQIILYNH